MKKRFWLSLLVVLSTTLMVLPEGVLARSSYNSIIKKARKHLNQNNHEKAKPLYLKAQKLRPKDGEPVAALAWITFRTRNKDKTAADRALKQAERAVKLSPKNPMVHNVLGAIYFGKGRTKEAVQEFRTVLELDPLRKCGGCGDLKSLLGPLPKKKSSKKNKKK